MYLIAFKYYYNDQPIYIINDLDQSYSIGYDPRKALAFPTRKEANWWANDNIVDQDNLRVIKRSVAFSDFEKWLSTGLVIHEHEKINRNLSYQYNPEIHDRIHVLEWHWATAEPKISSAIKSKDYHSWPRLYTLFEHLWSLVSYDDLENETLYHTFQICTERDGDFDTFKSELDLVVDRITYEEQIDGVTYKRLPIFDHGLNEYDSSALFYNPNADRHIIKSVRYSYQAPKHIGTLESCFKYLKTHLYYD